MVLVGFVIKKDSKVLDYINRFKEVFSTVRASPFGKKPLFNSFYPKTKIFNDRIVFMYSGNISAFSFIMFLLKYAIVTLLLITLFLELNNLIPVISSITLILTIVGVITYFIYYFTYSKYGFWFWHLKSFNKPKYKFKSFDKKLLTSTEIVNCFIWGIKPKFKREIGD